MKQYIQSIGKVSWSNTDIKEALPDFLKIHNQKVVTNNQGGMRAPHLVATWFMLKQLNPSYVIESGVWKGQGTWLIEQALPSAQIHSIELDQSRIEYKPNNAIYYDKDFTTIDWSFIENKEDVVLFFDDHQNALERIKACKELGFKHIIFEDNYPSQTGDCYTPKKIFQKAGKQRRDYSTLSFLQRLTSKRYLIKPNEEDFNYLVDNLEVYYEFPPIVKNETTRWGDEWNNENYPTPTAVYNQTDLPKEYDIFKEESTSYTWICYVKLK